MVGNLWAHFKVQRCLFAKRPRKALCTRLKVSHPSSSRTNGPKFHTQKFFFAIVQFAFAFQTFTNETHTNYSAFLGAQR